MTFCPPGPEAAHEGLVEFALLDRDMRCDRDHFRHTCLSARYFFGENFSFLDRGLVVRIDAEQGSREDCFQHEVHQERAERVASSVLTRCSERAAVFRERVGGCARCAATSAPTVRPPKYGLACEVRKLRVQARTCSLVAIESTVKQLVAAARRARAATGCADRPDRLTRAASCPCRSCRGFRPKAASTSAEPLEAIAISEQRGNRQSCFARRNAERGTGCRSNVRALAPEKLARATALRLYATREYRCRRATRVKARHS